MRASDRHRRSWSFALLVGAWLSTGAAAAEPPRVAGEGEPARVVREALARADARGDLDAWQRRAFDALRDEGWMWARVRIVAPVAADTGARIEIDEGPRATVGRFEVRGSDERLAALWRESTGLTVGSTLRPREWERRVRAGLRVLGERGHPFASITVLEQLSDPSTGAVELVVFVRTSDVAVIEEVFVDGATHTRPEVLARLTGLRRGDRVRESSLDHARSRLQGRPALIEEVEAIEVLRRSEPAGTVDVRVRVRQPRTTGRFAAAIGAVQDAESNTRLSGSMDLALLDLFGTARRFEGRWSDDGRARSRLDLAYLEPAVLGSSIDLGFELGQRHEDEAYDTFRADLRLRVASGARRTLGLSVGFDRSTFLGDAGRVRARQRVGASFGLDHPRPIGRGAYGALHSSVEAARVRDTRTPIGGAERVEASTTQTLVEFDGRVGRAFTPVVAAQVHLSWRSTETDRLPLPRSELWALGGATTVRGYEEERFLGERIAWGGAELVFGPARAGQAYVFVDGGWVQASADGSAGVLREERWLDGFGVGVRSPTTLGEVDLSLGFAERLGLDAGKLHLVLTRSF